MIQYFDNCATTQVDPEVLQILNKYHTETFFNPSARSTFSLQIANDISVAREKLLKLLGGNGELVFTSGGTESDNLGILGCIRKKSGNIVVTASEHSAVYNTVTSLANKGYEIRQTKVNSDGTIDIDDFVAHVDSDTLLACFMHVNNETGAINDVKRINSLVKNINPNTVTFCDGVQAVGKIPVNLNYLGVDLYTFSSHKFHCTKGAGALYIKKGVRVTPLVLGGGQEKGIRSGTEYVGAIVAMAKALEIANSLLGDNGYIFNNYKNIIRNALADIPNFKENCVENCSPAIMSLAFADIKGEVLLHMLEQYDIVVGTGSACSSKNKQSRIAKAIGLTPNYSEGVIRISFSKFNTLDQVKNLAEKLAFCVKSLRKTMLGK